MKNKIKQRLHLDMRSPRSPLPTSLALLALVPLILGLSRTLVLEHAFVHGWSLALAFALAFALLVVLAALALLSPRTSPRVDTLNLAHLGVHGHVLLCSNRLRLLARPLQPGHSLAMLPRLSFCHLLDGARVHGLQPGLFRLHLLLGHWHDGPHVPGLIFCEPSGHARVMEGVSVVGCVHDALFVLAVQHALRQGQHLSLALVVQRIKLIIAVGA
mmetsp:Transcript_18585/g.52244  ORF Transcript_18585/g.52244 Transcript_18585/m.52244 type:complete len:215 (+) Transcript_18585:202-846(+)